MPPLENEANASNDAANAGQTNEQNSAGTNDLERLKGTVDRLLEESKNWKSKYQDLKKKDEEKTQSELQSQGKYKEMYEKTAKELEDSKQGFLKEKIARVVTEEARKAGCVDPESLLKIGNHSLLEIDEEGNISGHDHFVEDAKKTKSYLFTAQKAPVVNSYSPQGANVQPKVINESNYLKLNEQDRKKVLAQLLK